MVHTIIPEILWAQRSNATEADKNVIYLTVNLQDVVKPHVELTSDKFSFEGVCEDDNKKYAISFEFYKEIDVENSKQHSTDRGFFFHLRKKEMQEEYWPRLTKDSKRHPFIKTDFDKWVDEDEQQEDTFDANAMGGMGGMPGGMGGMPGNFDLSQLMAGAGGMGGMGGMGGLPDFAEMGDIPPSVENLDVDEREAVAEEAVAAHEGENLSSAGKEEIAEAAVQAYEAEREQNPGEEE